MFDLARHGAVAETAGTVVTLYIIRLEPYRSPNRVVLFVVRASAVSRQPLQRDGRLGGVRRHVVRGVRLSALDHQMGGGHYCGHFVAGHTVIISKVRFPEVLYRDVAAVDVVPAFGQRGSVPLLTTTDVNKPR